MQSTQFAPPQIPPVAYEPPPTAPSSEPEALPVWTSNLPIEQTFSQTLDELSKMAGLLPTDPTGAAPAELHTAPVWSSEQALVSQPSFTDRQFVQQQQPSTDMPDHSRHGFQGQHLVAQVVDSLRSAAANSPLPRLPCRDSQERSSRTGSLSSEDMRYNSGHMPLSPSVSAPLTTYLGQRQVSPASGQSVSGYGQPIEDLGVLNMPQGQGQMMQGSGQVLQGQGQMMQGSGQAPQGQGQMFQGSKQVPQGQGQIFQGSGQVPQGQGQIFQGSGQMPLGQGQLPPSRMQAFHGSPHMPAGSRSQSLVLPGCPVDSAKLRHIQSDRTDRTKTRTRCDSSATNPRGKVYTLSFCSYWLSLHHRSIHTLFSYSKPHREVTSSRLSALLKVIHHLCFCCALCRSVGTQLHDWKQFCALAMLEAMQATVPLCYHVTLEFVGNKRRNPERAAIDRHPSTTFERDTLGQSALTLWNSSQLSLPDSEPGSLTAASQAAAWPLNSRHLSLESFPSGPITLHGYPSNFVCTPVPRPIHQDTYVLPQSDGAGDQSSEDFSLVNQNDLMDHLAAGRVGLEGRDDADSHQQGTGPSQILVLQPQVQHVVIIFLAKMRALVVRRRLQRGAATSTALDQRLRQRAVLARWARCKSPLLFLLTLHTQTMDLVRKLAGRSLMLSSSHFALAASFVPRC